MRLSPVLALCVALFGAGAALGDVLPPRPSASAPLPYMGMTFTNERYCPNVTLASAIARDSLRHLATTGANSVSIVVTRYQYTVTSTDIFAVSSPVPCTTTPNGVCVTASDTDVMESIAFAQSLGMKVMLKLQIDLLDAPGLWRGFIGTNMTAEQWDEWFASYTASITHYASIAEATGAHMLSVSCELVEASKQSQHWRAVIAQLRSVYSGVLIDSANWSPPGGSGEVTDKTWWDAVDVIGVDEYYMAWAHSRELPDGSYNTKADLLELWTPIVTQLEQLHVKFNRSVIFSEIGFCSGINGLCWKNKPVNEVPEHRTTNASLAAQATQYDAALSAMSPQPWFLGVFWWNWATDAAFGGPGNSCMDPKFKPAEGVLRHWYGAVQPAPEPPAYAPQCRCWL